MRSLRRAILACVLPAIIASAGMAAESEGAHDAKAVELLRQLSDLFAKAQSLRTNFLVERSFTVRGETQKVSSSYKFAMQRPNLLALILTWGDEGVTAVSDGRKLYTLRPAMKQYLAREAPKSMPELSEALYASLEALDGSVAAALVADIISADPYAMWMDGVIEADYLGTEKIKGGYCHHLRFTQKEMDWDMWLRAGDKPFPAQITFDTSKSLAKYFGGTPQLKGAKAEVTIRCGRWIVNHDPPANTFKFKPPAGAKLVDSFSKPKPPQKRQQPKEPSRPLVGLKAPIFAAMLLDGGAVRLADHIGKDIVILDFWASWCPPCRRALPILIDVAVQYAGRGVVFYAVNQREHPNKIKQFLDKSGLKFPIPLDPKGRIGQMYRVSGIPQTVIIGKDGTVQVVHVGFSSDLKNRLSRELDALLAGEDLTGKDAAEQEATTRPAGQR